MLEHRGGPARGSSGAMLKNAFFQFPGSVPGLGVSWRNHGATGKAVESGKTHAGT